MSAATRYRATHPVAEPGTHHPTPSPGRPVRPRTVRETAEHLVSTAQVVFAAVVAVAVLVGLVAAPRPTLQVLLGASLLFYVSFVGLRLLLHAAAGAHRPPTLAPVSVDDPALPIYTVLVPLYREANMLPSLARSLDGLSYPKDRLQVLLLLEEDDIDTRAAAVEAELPSWWSVVTVPDALPKGKPKALNAGLAQARGALTVVYDAEDRPDPDQLLKAVAAFRASGPEVACVQARLFFWNGDTSWVTRFYWVEYVVQFERVLPGLAALGLIPPLGGTSNHFRTDVLRTIAIPEAALPVAAAGVGAWDPWNVTEDAELAGALAAERYRVLMIDSITREEATATLRVADRQRRRWLKGYLQTGLVYTRHPWRMARAMGPLRWAAYTLLVLGSPVSLLLSPLSWGLTLAWLITRSPTVEHLLPTPAFYVGVVLLLAGNLTLFYELVGACLHRESYSSVKYLALTPLWWAFTSWSAYQVLWELARPSTRHAWNKTPHGHDLDKEEALAVQVPAVVDLTRLPTASRS